MKLRLIPESHVEVGCPGTWALELPTPSPDSKSSPKACPTCNPAMSPRLPKLAPAQAPVTDTEPGAQWK